MTTATVTTVTDLTDTTTDPTRTAPVPPETDAGDRSVPAGHVPTGYRQQTLARAVRSEWIKLRTLRSTWWGMGSVVLLLVSLGAIAAFVSTGSNADGDGFGAGDPLTIALTGADFAVLLVGVLGALAGAREYASRMISATVTSVPRRWQVVTAKSVALTAAVVVTAVVGVFAAFGVSMALLSANDAATVSLTDSGVLGEMLGMAGYISAIGLIGLGLGVLLRSVAASIGVLVGGIILLPLIAGALLPASLDSVLQYLPSSAGASFTTVQPAGEAVLGTTAGVLVLVGWVAAALAAAVVTITRRDV